jgi:hypothetical protein
MCIASLYAFLRSFITDGAILKSITNDAVQKKIPMMYAYTGPTYYSPFLATLCPI